ncbi:MAG: copper chaperone PCu(A)C [Luteibacter sp.]
MMLRTLAATLFALSATAAQAADAPAVEASAGWIRVLPGSLPAGAYVHFENRTPGALRIVGAESTDYGEAMIHRSSTEGGMGRMEMVDSVALPPNGKLDFTPGGYHVMLTEAKHPVKTGDRLTITFELSDGRKLPVSFVARPANATGPTD